MIGWVKAAIIWNTCCKCNTGTWAYRTCRIFGDTNGRHNHSINRHCDYITGNRYRNRTGCIGSHFYFYLVTICKCRSCITYPGCAGYCSSCNVPLISWCSTTVSWCSRKSYRGTCAYCGTRVCGYTY